LTAAGEAPKTEKAETLPTAKNATAGNGAQWIVQAGSFSRETNALVMRDQLKTKGFKAFVENASTSAGTVYRVRIGPMEGREAAEALVKRLNSSGNYHGMVMSYP
jgi:DedD protein